MLPSCPERREHVDPTPQHHDPLDMRLVLLLVVCTVPATAQERMTPLVRAVQLARASVVNIHSEKSPPRSANTIFSTSKDRKVSGMGTGIIIDERGYIVTNYHVVEDVDALDVSLGDGSRYRARTISFDRARDLAIIKIDAKQKLQVMPLGTSSDLMLAETVFAVGNAFGYEHTVTSGIVSAIGRDVEVNETQSYYNLIQTDASINPGNSGGPLLNLRGEVVGINVAIRAGAQRIGFAIPIDDARRAIAELMSAEKLFGVTAGIVTKDVKTGSAQRAIVDSVDQAASSSGLRKGDQIVRIDNVQVRDSVDANRALFGHRAGDTVQVRVLRNGESVSLNLQLARASTPEIAEAAPAPSRTVSLPRIENQTTTRVWKLLGLRLAPLPSSATGKLGSRYRGGMQVTDIRPGSPAQLKGIQRGDYLVGLHIWETLSFNDMAYILADEQLSQHNPLTFYIVRQGKTMFGQLPL